MRKWLCYILFLACFTAAKATHNRAGEITFRQISSFTYEFTITTFTYTLSPVDRDTVNVLWGDNTSSAAPRNNNLTILLPDYYKKNVYVIRHTFPGPGVYRVVMQDPTRNLGVVNIPNSVRVYFSVETTLIINPQISNNNTPVLLNYPLDKAAVGKRFVHNPGAYDADGDSLSYKLTQCTKELGRPIENYTYPKASHELKVDSIKGDLIWNAPVDTGKYNIAMNIEEWRHGVKIGNIERDMQVEVHQSDNRPPVNPQLPNICIEAGKLIDFTFTVKDSDDNIIDVQMIGGPFNIADTVKAAHFTKVASSPGFTTVRFSWHTDITQARLQPYDIIVKSTDNYPLLKLVDISSFNIKVMAPAPKNLTSEPGSNSISMNWSTSSAPATVGYEIYRSSGPLAVVLDSCTGGIPANSGYDKIGSTKNPRDTSFSDLQNLSPGNNYCYRVVAVLEDGLRSFPSNVSCSLLFPGMPSLTNASVTKLDQSAGEIFISWVKPRIDTLKMPAPGPYEYRIYRTDNLTGQNFELINTITTADLADTTYTDKNINTLQFPYNYKVELYNNTPGNRFLISKPETASSMFPDLYGSDKAITIKFAKNDPWVNTQYTIYRQNSQTANFDSIASSSKEEYTDRGLKNGQQYTYRIKSYGYRQLNGLIYKTINWSHINSTSAIDTVKPCAPKFALRSECKDFLNVLTWDNVNLTCSDNILKYKIYYKGSLEGQLTQIAEINSSSDPTFTYQHTPSVSLGGCYVVSAIDSSNNESLPTNLMCVDSCSGYKLPNVFTPNNDNMNDIYTSINPAHYVKKVEMKIFNRWGTMVFRTSDPDINWDGTNINTKQKVTPGVYYYICDVYEPRLTGIEIRTLKDFIYVYNAPSNRPFE